MFVKIKKTIDESLNTFFLSEDKKNTSILLNQLSKDKDIMKAYVAINNIENPPQIPTDKINDFLQENLKFVSELRNNKNKDFLKKFSMEVEKGSLDYHVETFLFENRSALNYQKHIEAENFIFEYIKNKVTNTQDILLKELNEEEKSVYLEYMKSPEEYKDKVITECLEILNEKIQKETDLETKILIYETKDKLMREKFDNNQTQNVIDFLTLKNNLLA